MPAFAGTHRESIGLGDFVYVIEGDQTSGSGHFVEDYRRMAGNIFGHVPREHTGKAVLAAGEKTRDDPDRLSFIEICLGKRCS